MTANTKALSVLAALVFLELAILVAHHALAGTFSPILKALA